MQAARGFQLAAARAQIEQALEQAGFDLLDDAAEPDVIQARRERNRDSSVVIVDGGGQMRFTRTRQLAPEQGQTRHGAAGRTYRVTRQGSETATVSYALGAGDGQDFAAILAELEQV